jgi:inositol 1,4,5-triphosphate receptor type 1/inositol 1,4,5-triphosphate receptor type 3
MDSDIKKYLTQNNADQLFDLFPESMQQLFDVCIIMKKIDRKYPNSKWVKDIQDVFADSQEKPIFEFCMKNLQNIEIFYEGNDQTLYFPSHPVFQKLSGETRDKIMFEIPRETQREKLINLL